jgi:hypothetical protein
LNKSILKGSGRTAGAKLSARKNLNTLEHPTFEEDLMKQLCMKENKARAYEESLKTRNKKSMTVAEREKERHRDEENLRLYTNIINIGSKPQFGYIGLHNSR